MNISLTPELEEFVNFKVQSGQYSAAIDVIQEGLRLLENQDKTVPSFTTEAELENHLGTGIRSMEQGKIVDGREAFARLRKKAMQ